MHWPATYVTSLDAMPSDMPTREMVINTEGQPVWRVCGGGVCIETPSGTKAGEILDTLCRPAGAEPTCCSPERGPSEVDEPGV